MRLFYTTTTGYLNDQPNPERSLGGYQSSSPVANDDFSNIFDEISVMTIRSGRDEYRAIVLKNEFPEKKTNVRLSMELSDHSICSYKLALAQLDIVDANGNVSMEYLQAMNNKPFRAQFVDMVPGAVVEVGNMDPGAVIGIWLCRHIDKDAARQQYNDVCKPDPLDPTGRRYIGVEKPTEELVNLNITWDD